LVGETLMEEKVKVIFDLNPEDQQRYSTEGVWAERVGPDEFRILNSPFFVFGVSADDVVKATLRDNDYRFERVVQKGGHSTYRIFLQDGRTVQGDDFRSRWETIRRLGATFENANDRFVSVDVTPAGDIVKVYDLLKQGEADGVWVFEEGNYEPAEYGR
jgi:Domain of unknown function (DUF4265)